MLLGFSVPHISLSATKGTLQTDRTPPSYMARAIDSFMVRKSFAVRKDTLRDSIACDESDCSSVIALPWFTKGSHSRGSPYRCTLLPLSSSKHRIARS